MKQWFLTMTLAALTLWGACLLCFIPIKILARDLYGGDQVERQASGYYIIHKRGRRTKTTEPVYNTLRGLRTAGTSLILCLPLVVLCGWGIKAVKPYLSLQERKEYEESVDAAVRTGALCAFGVFSFFLSFLGVNAALTLAASLIPSLPNPLAPLGETSLPFKMAKFVLYAVAAAFLFRQIIGDPKDFEIFRSDSQAAQ